MDIYSNPVTANMILSLENDSELAHKMETFAQQIAPSFFKTTYTNAAKNEKVVCFTYASFLSYSFKEMYDVRVTDSIECAIRKLGLDPIPYEDLALVKDSLKSYYFTEIMIGNVFLSNTDESILNLYHVDGVSKSRIADKHNLSTYKLNKILSKWTPEAYEGLLRVKHGEPYHEVMREAKNATQPFLTMYQINKNN